MYRPNEQESISHTVDTMTRTKSTNIFHSAYLKLCCMLHPGSINTEAVIVQKKN